MKINLNDIVKIRILPYGQKIMAYNHQILWADYPNEKPYVPPAVDKDGYTEMQLWKVAREFGRVLADGNEMPIEAEIIVGEKDG